MAACATAQGVQTRGRRSRGDSGCSAAQPALEPRLRIRPVGRFRVLNVVDDVTRESLVAVPDTSICCKRVLRELTDLITVRGKPGIIVRYNGTELA